MKIALLGDIALFGQNTVCANGWQNRFEAIKKILEDCDYVIGNLETPLTDYKRAVGGKSAYIKGTPEDVEILNYLRITHVSLANNHAFDYCEQGLLDTISCLNDNKIGWYGIDGKKIELENNILLMGYCCYSTNAVGLKRHRISVNLLDPFVMEEDISNAERKGLLPVLSCHWGQEHVHFPNYDHVQIARKLAKDHRIIIHGHHPHVIQGMETVGESLINYSLGNFCFDDVYTSKSAAPLVRLSKDNQESYILTLSISDGKLCEYDIIPFTFEGGKYIIDYTIKESMKAWSLHLADEKEAYIKMRASLLQQYYNERKELRDFNWYIKRLNPDSAMMIIRAKINRKHYYPIVEAYVNNGEKNQ